MGTVPAVGRADNHPAVYTVDEIASRFRLHPRTVLRLAERGELPAFRCGKLFRFPAVAIDELLERGASS